MVVLVYLALLLFFRWYLSDPRYSWCMTEWYDGLPDLVRELVSCPYCLSFWCSAVIGAVWGAFLGGIGASYVVQVIVLAVFTWLRTHDL